MWNIRHRRRYCNDGPESGGETKTVKLKNCATENARSRLYTDRPAENGRDTCHRVAPKRTLTNVSPEDALDLFLLEAALDDQLVAAVDGTTVGEKTPAVSVGNRLDSHTTDRRFGQPTVGLVNRPSV